MHPHRTTAVLGVIALGVALAGFASARSGSAHLQLNLATVHAAVLTTARSAADSSDDLVLHVTTRGAAGDTASYRVPEAGYFALRLDQVTPPRSFLERRIAAGETLEIEVTVREGRAADATSLGAFRLALTNTADELQWRSLECTSTCRVLTDPAASVVRTGAAPVGGVVELTGAGGTYHVNLQGQRRE